MDNYSQGQMIGIGISFLILPVAAVGARLWAKTLSPKGIKLDDYLIIAALAISIACCITQLIAAVGGQLGQHQTVGPDGQPILDDPRFLVYEKCKFASQILATVGLGLTKASILVFYINIFQAPKFKIWAQVMIGLVTAWTLSFFFSNLFTCYPITPLVEAFYGNDCIDGVSMWWASCITDFIMDFIILLMPIPMVLRLKLPLKQKIATIGLFMLGILVCAISVTRFAMYVHVGNGFLQRYNDETYYTSPVFFWTNIEISLGVISACLPTLRPIWLHFKGDPRMAKKSYQWSPYYRFGSSRTDPNSARGNDDYFEEDSVGLNAIPSVNTVVETGISGAKEHLDGNSIAVERDMYTDSRTRRLD